jgi:nucleotide-binding universal stress UspA family protein
MIRFKKILVATDFSEGSKIAYTYANELANKFGGKVDLIHVIPTMKYFGESLSLLGLPLDMNKEVYPKLMDQCKGYIEDDLNNYIHKGVRGSTDVRIDLRPYEVIVEQANALPYDLLIIGTHGADTSSLMHGHMSDRVIRLSKVPVLSAPKGLPEKGMHHIMVPIDFSEVSWQSLYLATSLAAAVKGDLTLLYVKELYGAEGEVPEHRPNEDETDLIRKKLFERFHTFASADQKFTFEVKPEPSEDYDWIVASMNSEVVNIKVHTIVKYGVSAHYEISDFANEHADLVVMTTHGRTGLSQVLLGSTTERVARHCHKPVLTIRPA